MRSSKRQTHHTSISTGWNRVWLYVHLRCSNVADGKSPHTSTDIFTVTVTVSKTVTTAFENSIVVRMNDASRKVQHIEG